MTNSNSTQNIRHQTNPLVFVIPGVVTGTILVICIIVTLCICARYRGWCRRIFQSRRTRQPQKQEIERIKTKIIDQYRRRKRKSRKNDVIPDVIDSTLICAICLDGYVSTISKRHRMLAQLTQCNHHFHFNCIFQWLDRNPSCPVCRTPVVLSDEKIKAIGLQDVCGFDKPLDLMPTVSEHNVMILTPTAEASASAGYVVPSSGTPSPRLMAAYLLPSNQDHHRAPSLGTSSTFSTMSSVKSSGTYDRNTVNALPILSADPQPSTSRAPTLETLNVNNLPKLVAPQPPVTSEVHPPTQVSLPRTPSQMVVNVEINALAFYNDSSSSDSSQSDDRSSRNSSTSTSSFDSTQDIWLPDGTSSIRPTSDDFDNYGSTEDIMRRPSSKVESVAGLDNPAFEQDFEESPRRQFDLPRVHCLNTDPVNCSINCDTMLQFSINDNNMQRHSTPVARDFRRDDTQGNGARFVKSSSGSMHDLRTVPDNAQAMDPSRNSIAEIPISSSESAELLCETNSRGTSNSVRQGLRDDDVEIAQIIPTDLKPMVNTQNGAMHLESSELHIVNGGGCYSVRPNRQLCARRTNSTRMHDYVFNSDSRPRSAEVSPNIDGRARDSSYGSYGHTAKKTVMNKKNQQGSTSPRHSLRREIDEYTATLNDIDWSNRPGSSRYIPKPRTHIRRTPSAIERPTTSCNNARTLPSRSPPSVVESPEEGPIHSSGSMPDFHRPTWNGRMWQNVSSSLTALSGADAPPSSTHM